MPERTGSLRLSARTRIFLAVLIVYLLGMAWLLSRITQDIDPRYRESAEESQVDMAQLLASTLEQDVVNGQLHLQRFEPLLRSTLNREFSAQIYGLHKTRTELRVTVTNHAGIVQYDSTGRHVGEDFSRWHDVSRTLQGRYGARTTRDVPDDPRTTVLYVAAPVRWQNTIAGVVSVGKPVQSFGQFVADARKRTIWVGVGSASVLLVLALLLSVWLIRPFGFMRDLWRWLQRQQHVSPGRVWRQALLMLRATSHDVRDAVAGRQDMAVQVNLMSHELKSPLAAIGAAAELLQDPHMPAAQRQLFLDNISRETLRIRQTIERLQELSRLESLRVLDQVQDVNLHELLQEVVDSAQLPAQQRQLQLHVHAPESSWVEGDRFLLFQALSNLLANAMDFAPAHSRIELSAERQGHGVLIHIDDNGPGLPDFALNRVFEKFYSLPRPHTQRKSTGLGLAFVQEIAKLHGGSVQLGNRMPQGEPSSQSTTAHTGARATLQLPMHAH